MTAEDVDLEDLSERVLEEPGENIEERFHRLVGADDEEWSELDTAMRLQLTGVLINYSEDLGKIEGLEKAIELNEELSTEDLEDYHKAQRYYQLASGYSSREAFDPGSETEYTFFESSDLVNSMGYLRAAVASDYLDDLRVERVVKTYTDFANLLSRVGRVVEALRWYDNALRMDPGHALALGNRGQCKMEYSSLLFTEGHSPMFLYSAYSDLEEALEKSEGLYPRAEQTFSVLKQRIVKYSDDRLAVENHDEYELGESGRDEEYHEWVLDNGLYLNPLNDISGHSSVAHDYFHLPDMLLPDDEDFPYPGIYNQVKQEFVSARYLYFEGVEVEDEDGHFSDRGVKLPDTLDYSVYGYRTEQVKTALRLSYSIFDKLAEIINHYWGVGHEDPNFNQVWYQGGDYNQGLAEPFQDSDNWPLNALFWIKKDFHHSISERDEESVVTVAHELESLRHLAEHDYMKVFHDGIVSEPPENRAVSDSLYEAVGKSELEDAGLEMLRLARAGLIYVSLAVHFEERKKREELDRGTLPVAGGALIPDHLKE
jgi:tetratricopeptide (TPR) repeat protein